MKYSFLFIFVLSFILFYRCSTDEYETQIQDETQNQTSQQPIFQSEPFEYRYNLHPSLDRFNFYKDSIQSIISSLNNLMPITSFYHNADELLVKGVNIYSWIKEDEFKPFSSEIGETEICICGYVDDYIIMSLEVSEEYDFNPDFNPGYYYSSNFKYAIIAHEFLHVYQTFKSQGLDYISFWMLEGQAVTFESLYVKENMNDSDYISRFINLDTLEEGIQVVEEYETYEGFNKNYPLYGDITVFMNLALSKILQEQGYTEKESFLLIFKKYWESNPNEANSEEKFEEVFGISTSEFYQRLNDFITNPENLVPEISLSEIFEKE